MSVYRPMHAILNFFLFFFFFAECVKFLLPPLVCEQLLLPRGSNFVFLLWMQIQYACLVKDFLKPPVTIYNEGAPIIGFAHDKRSLAGYGSGMNFDQKNVVCLQNS